MNATVSSGDAKGVFQRDLPKTQVALQSWVAARMEGARDLQVADLKRTGGGMSHEILSLDVTWRQDGRSHHQGLVVRVDPVHYRKRHLSNLRREFEVLSILGRRGDVPVPKVFWYETDTGILGAEFYAMERISGRVVSDRPPYQIAGWAFDLSVPERQQLWSNAIATLAKIHRVPVIELQSLRRNHTDVSDLDQQLQYWRKNYEWAMESRADAVYDAAWDWLAKNRPATSAPGLSWGDAHLRNLMFDGVTCCAVLDWEDVSLGGPLLDIGRWFLTDALHAAYGLPHLAGMGRRADLLSVWESLTGLSAADVRWFEIFNGCQGASTLMRTERLQIELLGGMVGPEAQAHAALKSVVTHLLDS